MPNVSTGTAARALDVTRSTLLRWMKAGKVTPASTTAGRHQRWDIDDLRRQLAGHEHQAAEAEPARLPVAAAIVTSHGRVLISERRAGAPRYGFITGKIRRGETAPDAAAREVLEETGLAVTTGRIIASGIPHKTTGRAMTYVHCWPSGQDAITNLDDDENERVWWAQLPEAFVLLSDMNPTVRAYLQERAAPSAGNAAGKRKSS